MVDGLFEADGAGGAHFHEPRGVGPATIAEIQAQLRHRLLSVLARRGVLEREDAERLREIDAEHLVYESAKPGAGGNVSLMLPRSN